MTPGIPTVTVTSHGFERRPIIEFPDERFSSNVRRRFYLLSLAEPPLHLRPAVEVRLDTSAPDRLEEHYERLYRTVDDFYNGILVHLAHNNPNPLQQRPRRRTHT